MAMSEVFNPSFLRNLSQSIGSLLPDSWMYYVRHNMDTVPKFLTHVLIIMAICDVLLILSSLAISFLTFLAAALLSLQTAIVLITIHYGTIDWAPRILEPNQYRLGVCLGLTIGGTIVSFFQCLAFGRIHAYCAKLEETPEQSCGWRGPSLNGVWWWSSCIFWLNFLCSILLAVGNDEIAATSRFHRYEAIDPQGMGNAGGGGYHESAPSYHQQASQARTDQGSIPAFAQQQPAPSSSFAASGYGGSSAGTGRYHDIPDVVAPSNASGASHPLQSQQQQQQQQHQPFSV